MGAEPPAPFLQILLVGDRCLDHHDLHLVIVISPVEEGDAGVVAQAWAFLGLLDLTQQLHDLLCGGVFRGTVAHQGLSVGRCHTIIVGQAHLSKIFGGRERQGSECCASSPHRPPTHPPPRALLTTLAIGIAKRCSGVPSRVLDSGQELALPLTALAYQAEHQLLQLQQFDLEGEVLSPREPHPCPPHSQGRAGPLPSSPPCLEPAG